MAARQPPTKHVTGDLFSEGSCTLLKLTTHIHKCPRQECVERYLHYPHFFVAWCLITGTTFPLLLLFPDLIV